MAQVQDGTVQITNGGNRVIASAGADWSDPEAELAGGKSVWFSIIGSSLLYRQISSINPPGTVGNITGDRWEIVIVGVIGDPTSAAAPYIIHWNFTPNAGFPIIDPGDVQTAQILARFVNDLDLIVSGASGFQQINVAGAGNTNSNQTAPNHTIKVTLAAGAYIATVSLLAIGRAGGNRVSIGMNFPASTPKLQIFNVSPSGTKLWEWTGDGAATSAWAEFVFDGTAWYLEKTGFNE
jgi:hypothetical protein